MRKTKTGNLFAWLMSALQSAADPLRRSERGESESDCSVKFEATLTVVQTSLPPLQCVGQVQKGIVEMQTSEVRTKRIQERLTSHA